MTTRTQNTLVAVFPDAATTNDAADELKANGFSSSDIYISSEEPGYYAAGSEAEIRDERPQEHGFKAWIKSLFGKEDYDDSIRYEEMMQSGSILLAVDTTDENIDKAVDILNNHSPIEVRSGTGVEAPETRTGSTPRTGTTTARSGATTGQTQSIPVVEEELRVGKRAVLRGGVRVYSRMVEEPVEETVNLQEEHVRVDRQPADRPATEGDFRTGEEQMIEVKEYAEEPVVSKQARVVEDIRVGKDKTQRSETVRDTIRRTETNVENINESNPAAPGSTKNQTGR